MRKSDWVISFMVVFAIMIWAIQKRGPPLPQQAAPAEAGTDTARSAISSRGQSQDSVPTTPTPEATNPPNQDEGSGPAEETPVDLLQLRELPPLFTSASDVASVVFNQAGSLLATGHQDGMVRVWNFQMRRLTLALVGHGSAVKSLHFSSDGRQLASASEDGTLRFWDLVSGQLIRAIALRGLDESSGQAKSPQFNPGGNVVGAITSREFELRLWDASSGAELRTIGTGQPIYRFAFSGDSRLLAIGSGFGWRARLCIVDLETGGRLEFQGRLSFATAVAFTPDGLQVAGTGDGVGRELFVWTLETSQWHELELPIRGDIYSLAFRPDSRLLAASGDGTISLFGNLRTPDPSWRTIHGPWGGVGQLTFSPDGTLLVGATETAVRVWVLEEQHPRRQ